MNKKNFTPIDYLLQTRASLKEGEPVKVDSTIGVENKEDIEIHKVVEHEPDAEVKPYIQVRKEKVDVHPDLKQMGVEESQEVSFPTHQKVKLPISDEKILKGHEAPITSSIRWLAELCIYILRKAHLALKQVHGKIVRVTVYQ